MVLFEEDFYKEGAIVVTDTTNLSFLRMAIILNKLGVKNNKFFLSLLDKDLRGVNPHDLQDDSLELKQRIAYECKRNPFYFLREVIRVTASGSGGVPYILNRANLAQAWLFFNSIDSFLVMPRQIGKTIGTACLQSWFIYIAAMFCNWGMFCKGIKLQNENVDRLKKLRDALPKWLLHQTTDDTNNKEGIFYDALKNGLMTFVSQSDKIAAGDQARGQSFAVESWDEVAYYNNIHLSYDAATAGMNTAGEQARASGVPSAVIITTTAGDIDDPRGRWCYKTVCDCMRFHDTLYDCKNVVELKDIIHNNSRNGMVYLEFNHKQLGKDDEWFERVTRNKDPKIIAKDYRNQWLHGADGSIFSKEMLEKIVSSKREPVTTTSYESLIIRWHDDPQKLMSNPSLRNRPYVIGCDTSDNVCRDFTTMCMVDPYDLHPVCTFKCNATNLWFVAKCIAKFLVDFPRAIFIPERNKNGAMFLDYLFAVMKRDQFNPLKRIYNKYFQEYTKDSEQEVRNLNYDDGSVRKNFGFTTTKSATSREFLYSSVLMTALKLVGDRLYDESIISEISGLTVKNGRVDHSDIGHDDLLISFLLACYFIIFGLNHQLYGIEPDEMLCNIQDDGQYIDAERKRQLANMKAQIVDLRNRLKKCTNSILRSTYERNLQQLLAVVGDEVPLEEDVDAIKPLDQINRQAALDAQRAMGLSSSQLMRFI